jgi:RimK family alpha-L-glutamate ligase
MRIGIVGRRGSWYVTALQTELARRGIDAPCFPVTRLTARLGGGRPHVECCGEPLESCDVLLVRAIPGGSLEQVIYRMDTLHRIENAGVRVINSPSTIERSVDKYYTLTLAEDAGLPTPRTIVAERFDDALAGYAELGGDVVVKPLFGSEGRGIVRITDVDSAHRVFKALELGNYVYYLQEYIPHNCEDIRVFVINGEAVAAMVRRGKTWKTNIANGALAAPLVLDDALRRMSIEAVRALGAVYAGVDILPCEGGGYKLIEVNGIPGWRGLQSATGIDVPGLLLDHILNEMR